MNSTAPSSFWNLVAKNPKPILRLAGIGEGAPLYMVHAIAGDVGLFGAFAEAACEGRTVYGIQAPSQKVSAEFGSSVHALASYYVDAVMKAQPSGPILIGGWSSGAIVALEMAQLLRKRGRDVPLLVIFDGILHNTGAELPRWHPRYGCKLLLTLPRWIIDNRVKRFGARRILKRIRIEWKMALASRSQGQNAQAESILDTFMDLAQWPPARAAFSRALHRALDLYEPELYGGRVLVYAAKTQPLFRWLQVEACWTRIAPNIEVRYVWGTHQDMMERGRATIMGKDLSDYLAALPASRPAALD